MRRQGIPPQSMVGQAPTRSQPGGSLEHSCPAPGCERSYSTLNAMKTHWQRRHRGALGQRPGAKTGRPPSSSTMAVSQKPRKKRRRRGRQRQRKWEKKRRPTRVKPKRVLIMDTETTCVKNCGFPIEVVEVAILEAMLPTLTCSIADAPSGTVHLEGEGHLGQWPPPAMPRVAYWSTYRHRGHRTAKAAGLHVKAGLEAAIRDSTRFQSEDADQIQRLLSSGDALLVWNAEHERLSLRDQFTLVGRELAWPAGACIDL